MDNPKLVKIDEILSALEMVAQVAEMFPQATLAAAAADQIMHVIQAGIRAHEQVTGEALDLSKLHKIDPVS